MIKSKGVLWVFSLVIVFGFVKSLPQFMKSESSDQVENRLDGVPASQDKRDSSEKEATGNLSSAQTALSPQEATLRQEFLMLAKLKGSLSKAEMRRETLDRLARDPEMIQIAQRVLEDLDWTLKAFPQEQAEMRIYSIKLLKVKGQLGDVKPLEQSTREISDQLKTSKALWAKGRENDLTDLLGAWIGVQGRDEVLKNPSELFKKFQYDPSLKAPFSQAVIFFLRTPTSNVQVATTSNSRTEAASNTRSEGVSDGQSDTVIDMLFKPYWNNRFI